MYKYDYFVKPGLPIVQQVRALAPLYPGQVIELYGPEVFKPLYRVYILSERPSVPEQLAEVAKLCPGQVVQCLNKNADFQFQFRDAKLLPEPVFEAITDVIEAIDDRMETDLPPQF
jgi:hypothetical protein